MKTLLIFYSYTGHTKALAQTLAALEAADIVEIKDTVSLSKKKAHFSGGFAAMRNKAWPIQPLTVDLSAYDRLILMSPVWGSKPTPAVNMLLEQLPEGKSVFVKMVSGSGHSSCKKRLEAVIRAKGSTLEGFEDIKA